ncbi:MAG: RNA polymerase sigma factor [Bacteroidaceae bacterium]|nr:RNA polymerase sigma factor [Bacteroidaceae bacterium]
MTDRELTQQVIIGSHSAFAEIVRRYSGMVFSKAIGVTRSEEGAAEVTQQTFVRAYESIDSWRGTELGPWLSAIAVHTALKLLDKERRRHTSPIDELKPNILSNLSTDTSYSDEHEVALQQMEAAISELSEQDQQLLHLHYYELKKTDDIARITGLSQSNVLVRLHRIRERLKTKLHHERNN